MLSLRPFAALLLSGLCLAWGGCMGAQAEGERPSAAAAGEELTVRRGSIQERWLVTGELVAERADPLAVPRNQASPQVQVRWMEEDGMPVKAGQRIVEFDNSSVTADLEEKKLAAANASNELARMAAEGDTTAAEKAFAVQEKRSALEKARIAAAVSAELLTAKDYRDRQTALRRAELELEKAEEDLAAFRRAHVADREVKRIELQRSLREIEAAEKAIDVLTLRAPRDGIVLIAEHPWEGRKLQVGDSLWMGMQVASIPDLGSMMVEASLPDVDDGRVRAGDRVVCYLDAYPDVAFPGRVVEISPVARESRRISLRRFFTMKVALDKVDRARMRPGMSVRVEVRGRETPGALLVPRAALDLSADKPRVLLADGAAAEVLLGVCNAQECAVQAVQGNGLREGTRLRARGTDARRSG
jgi:multidrug resistance efflux pump